MDDIHLLIRKFSRNSIIDTTSKYYKISNYFNSEAFRIAVEKSEIKESEYIIGPVYF